MAATKKSAGKKAAGPSFDSIIEAGKCVFRFPFAPPWASTSIVD
jgi:hypothetical protein